MVKEEKELSERKVEQLKDLNNKLMLRLKSSSDKENVSAA